MASHSGSHHNDNNPNIIPLFYSKTPPIPNCGTPDNDVSPLENFDRDSLGNEECNRHDEYIDKTVSDKRIEKVVRKILNSTAKQDAEASLVRQKEERNTLNWLEKLTSSVRPSIDKSSLPQFNGGPDDDIKEFFLQFKRTATFNKWDNNEQLCAFPLCLNKSASIFYESLSNKIKQDLKLIQQAFQNEYEPPERIWIKKTQLYGLKEGEKGLEHFIASLEKLSQELKVSEETKRDLFIQGVNSSLKRRLLLSQPETYTQAVRIARVNNSVNIDDDARIVETVIKTMTKLQNQSAKHNTVSFADTDTPPVAAYSTTPANLANPENATREVARLNNEVRKLKMCLRRQTNNNFVQNQGHNLIPVNQPTCFICNKMGHLARHCKEKYQDPRIPQNNNPKYPYRKNFTQQPQWRNNTNWAPRYFDNRNRNMNDNYTPPDLNNQNWRSTNTNDPQQTYKDNYFKSRQQNNNWNNVQNTRTGTHESQKKNISIQILGVDSISQYQENDFEYDDNTSLEYEDAEDYLWDDSYDYGYKSYTNNQMSTFDENYPYETNIGYYTNPPARDHTSYYRLDYTPLNPSHEDENNRIQQKIKSLHDNHKRMTHEINCLQDQIRYLLQHITEQSPLPQENEEMNKIDFPHLNAAIDEPQYMENSTYEDPENINNEASLFISPNDIKSIVRVNQNDINRIVTDNCPEIPDDDSKAETKDYVTYQHITPGHFEEISNENDQKKDILEETIMPVRLIDLNPELVFDQEHTDTSLMPKELDHRNESNNDLSSKAATMTELKIKVQSESDHYNQDDKDQLGIIETPLNNGMLNQSTDGEYCTTMEEHRESCISNQISLSSLNVLGTSSENQGTTQLKVNDNHDIRILKNTNVFLTKWKLYEELEYAFEPVKKLHSMTLKKDFSDQLPHISSKNILFNLTLHFSESFKESRSLTIAALLLQLLLFIPIFLLCAKDTDHEPIYDFNMTKPLVNEHVNKAENKFKTFFENQISYYPSISKFPIFLKIPSLRKHIITNSYQDNVKDNAVLGKVTKNGCNFPLAIMFKTPMYLNITVRTSIGEYDQKFNKEDLVTNNLFIWLFCFSFTTRVNEIQGK